MYVAGGGVNGFGKFSSPDGARGRLKSYLCTLCMFTVKQKMGRQKIDVENTSFIPLRASGPGLICPWHGLQALSVEIPSPQTLGLDNKHKSITAQLRVWLELKGQEGRFGKGLVQVCFAYESVSRPSVIKSEGGTEGGRQETMRGCKKTNCW